jgi:hypothetical protein
VGGGTAAETRGADGQEQKLGAPNSSVDNRKRSSFAFCACGEVVE